VHRGNRFERLTAIIEVLIAFALVHAAYRALKYFTVVGQWEGAAKTNFIPGTVMILFTIGVLWVCRRDFGAYGLTLKGWQHDVNLGLALSVLLVAAAAVGLMVTRVHFDPAHPHENVTARLAGAGFGLLAVVFLVCVFQRERSILRRVPPAFSLLLLIVLLSVPLLVAARFNRPVPHAALTVAWLFFGAGFGEEIFYRGYIQSRVDQAFGRPFRLWGIDFGIGLVVSSLLFGFLHALNTVDYFHGRFDFGWWFGAQNFCLGLFYGCLRAKSGSILPAAIVHGLFDVLGTVPGLISGP
jgi:membrane protease YdiL (CAAX protease family)